MKFHIRECVYGVFFEARFVWLRFSIPWLIVVLVEERHPQARRTEFWLVHIGVRGFHNKSNSECFRCQDLLNSYFVLFIFFRMPGLVYSVLRRERVVFHTTQSRQNDQTDSNRVIPCLRKTQRQTRLESRFNKYKHFYIGRRIILPRRNVNVREKVKFSVCSVSVLSLGVTKTIHFFTFTF